MKNQGISIIGIIVFLGLMALIVWGLDYIITKDFVVVRAPTVAISNNNIDTTPATTTPTVATSTPTNITPTKTTVPTNPPTTPASSDLTVTYTDKGFSPTSLKVIKGQTVTFVNNSSGKMWVAANPFPTSSEYPAFNEKSGIESGSSWSFTFDKTGTWFYHNHYNPPQGAKIVVNAK
jgi:plastocyanin